VLRLIDAEMHQATKEEITLSLVELSVKEGLGRKRIKATLSLLKHEGFE